MPTPGEIIWLCVSVALIIAGIIMFCMVAWRRRIMPDEWDLEPMGEASSYRRDK